jgi:hypothetical protein
MPSIDTPFASLSLIAAPAVLTNASSVLILSTSNRFARAIDRARVLSAELGGKDPGDAAHVELRFRQLARVERRSLVLLHALRLFYLSLASFAGASFSSLLGAIFAGPKPGALYTAALLIATVGGILGVGGLVLGCVLLVRETRLAVLNIREEAEFLERRYAEQKAPSPLTGDPQ